MNLYLDIETIPTQRKDAFERVAADIKAPSNYKDAKKIEQYITEHADEAWRKTALDGGYGEIVVLGWAFDDDAVETRVRMTTADSEAELLTEFYTAVRAKLDAHPSQMLNPCGHNLGFDLRFLHHRSVVLGVPPSFWLRHNAAPWQGKYTDTMYEWSGAKGGVKLTTLCHMLDIEVDDQIDGAGVWDAYKAGNVALVEEHCRADVERVRQIDRRLRFAER